MLHCDDRLRESAVIALLIATAGRTPRDSSEGYVTESKTRLMSSLVGEGELFP